MAKYSWADLEAIMDLFRRYDVNPDPILHKSFEAWKEASKKDPSLNLVDFHVEWFRRIAI